MCTCYAREERRREPREDPFAHFHYWRIEQFAAEITSEPELVTGKTPVEFWQSTPDESPPKPRTPV
jgi:hypothetical protein